jgi:hypothetical protein
MPLDHIREMARFPSRKRSPRPARYAGLVALVAVLLSVGAPEAAEPGTVEITRADCSRLVKHVPAPDVAYQPGVDVNGNPVAPADLDGGYQVALPETIFIPITVLLQERFGIPANSVLYKGEALIGVAAVSLDGEQVTFNGQPLTSPEAQALSAACQRYLNSPPPQ